MCNGETITKINVESGYQRTVRFVYRRAIRKSGLPPASKVALFVFLSGCKCFSGHRIHATNTPRANSHSHRYYEGKNTNFVLLLSVCIGGRDFAPISVLAIDF